MTTTDIARLETNAVAVLSGASEALDRLGQWVTAAQQAHQLVAPLVGTAFVPEAYKPKISERATPEEKAEARATAVANATAAVLQGITLGLDPLTSLQQIYIVHGRPGMYARLMVALVQSRGHELWTEDLTDTRAVVCGRRAGKDYVERVTITMDQARKAGWTSNAAYTKTPQDMLWARAASRVCNRIAPEVLMGIASVEEIRDEIKVEAEVGATRTVRPPRRSAPAIEATTVDDPPLDDEPATAPAAPEPAAARLPDTGIGITKAQQGKMHALLGESGRSDREIALVYIAGVTGREIATTKELTKREAGLVIEALEREKADAPDLDEDGGPALDGDDQPPWDTAQQAELEP